MSNEELDVRPLRKPDKHPTIFATYDTLAPGQSFVLVNNHDPKHLREEFDTEHAGSYGWDYLDNGPEQWRIQISKLASTPLPRIVGDTREIIGATPDSDAAGAIWKLQMRERNLDANIVRLPPEGGIDLHAGPDLDVLLVVLDGGGEITTELGTLEVGTGAIAWLPRRSRRAFSAGPDGLSYLTVHQRRQALVIGTSTAASTAASMA